MENVLRKSELRSRRTGIETQSSAASAVPMALLHLLLLLLGVSSICKAQHNPQFTPKWHTLTTTHEAHSIPAAEALKGYPIHIRGMVTLYDGYVDPRHAIMFVHDATGSIFLALPYGFPAVAVGTPVDLQGISGMGDFAPVIRQPVVRVIGKAQALPKVTHESSLTYLLTGQKDGQWVKIEGIVHSIYQTDHNANIQIAMRDGMVVAKMPREKGHDYTSLIDSRISIRAHAAPVFNGNHQMIGVQLLGPGLSTIRVVESGTSDVFQRPVSRISSLSRFGSITTLARRVHVRGKVTLSWPGSLLCVQDATHGLCANTSQITPLTVGQIVDLAGFAEVTESVPSLADAIFRMTAQPSGDPEPELPRQITAEQALHGNYGSELVTVEGQLIGRDVTDSNTTLILQSGAYVFAVTLPKDRTDSTAARWQNGSTLTVTGICSVAIDKERSIREGGEAKRKSFRLLLRSSSDVTVLKRASWWSPKHAVSVLAMMLTIALVVLCWIAVLSGRLKRQKRIIGESEERFRYMAQHDFLTGLPARPLLRERLDDALAKAKRSASGLALLMLDLDRFKQINDSLGHHAGDEALKVTARRVMEVIRENDTVARISGDEFIVLITDLTDPKEAELVAAKVVTALSIPFQIGERDIPLSASVGVCTGFGHELNAESLLKSVDLAMYHAKAQGRNGFQLYTGDMAMKDENISPFARPSSMHSKNETYVHHRSLMDSRRGSL